MELSHKAILQRLITTEVKPFHRAVRNHLTNNRRGLIHSLFDVLGNGLGNHTLILRGQIGGDSLTDGGVTLEGTNKKLVEELEEVKKDSQIIKSQVNSKLEKSQQLVEKYKAIAKTAVDKYIHSEARKIGVTVSDIKNRLTESYSFQDIDKAVEDLKQHRLNLNSLPFNTFAEKKPIKMQITEAKESVIDNSLSRLDDDIDESLLSFTD